MLLGHLFFKIDPFTKLYSKMIPSALGELVTCEFIGRLPFDG